MLQSNQQELADVVKIQTLQQVESELMIHHEEKAPDNQPTDTDLKQHQEKKVEVKNKFLEEEMKRLYNGLDKQNKAKHKISTIAMKLKLSLEKNQKAQEGVTVPAPMFFAPRFKKSEKEHQVRSIMVGGLFRGLTEKDLVEYFERFGAVIEYKEPLKSQQQDDGTKFVFMKFIDCDAAEKAIGMLNELRLIGKISY